MKPIKKLKNNVTILKRQDNKLPNMNLKKKMDQEKTIHLIHKMMIMMMNSLDMKKLEI